jgi:hypothetical protein
LKFGKTVSGTHDIAFGEGASAKAQFSRFKDKCLWKMKNVVDGYIPTKWIKTFLIKCHYT